MLLVEQRQVRRLEVALHRTLQAVLLVDQLLVLDLEGWFLIPRRGSYGPLCLDDLGPQLLELAFDLAEGILARHELHSEPLAVL